MLKKKKSANNAPTPTVFTKQELDIFLDKYTSENASVPVLPFEKTQNEKVTRDQSGKILRKTMTEAIEKNKIKTKALTTGQVNQFGFISSISESFADGFKHARYEKDPIWEYTNSDLVPVNEPKIINQVEVEEKEEKVEAEKVSPKSKESKAAVHNILPDDGKILEIADVGLKNARNFKSMPTRNPLRRVLTEVDAGIYDRGERFDFSDGAKKIIKGTSIEKISKGISIERISPEIYPDIFIAAQDTRANENLSLNKFDHPAVSIIYPSDSIHNDILMDSAILNRKYSITRNNMKIESFSQIKPFSYFNEMSTLHPEKEKYPALSPINEDGPHRSQRLSKLALLTSDDLKSKSSVPGEYFNVVVRPRAPNPFNSDRHLVNESKKDYSLIDWMKKVNNYKTGSTSTKSHWLPINIGAVAEFGKTVYPKDIMKAPEFKDSSTFDNSSIINTEILKPKQEKLMISCPNLPIKLKNRFWNTGL